MAYGIATGFPISWAQSILDDYMQRGRAWGMTKARFDVNAGVTGNIFDQWVNSALAAGLSVQGMIGGSPSDTTTSYASKCTGVVNFFKDRITEWELMNEPNLQSGWGSGVNYATVAKAGADAIQTVYSGVGLPAPHIVLGGISNLGAPGNTSAFTPWNWLASIYTLPAGHAWFNSVAYHPYGFTKNASGLQAFQNAAGWQIMADAAGANLRAVMIANGDTAKQISVNENGAPTWSDGVVSNDWLSTTTSDPVGMTEQAVSDFHVLCISDWKTRSWARDYYVYSEKDRWQDVSSTLHSREGHFGCLRADFSKKPAWDAIAALIVGLPTPGGISVTGEVWGTVLI